MDSILQFDTSATRFINGIIPHNQFFDLIFSFFSLRGMSVIVWVFIFLFLVIIEERRDKLFLLHFISSITVVALLVESIKFIIQRPRPYIALHLINNSCMGYSFPSGHAAIAFASATVLSAIDKKRVLFYYLVAVLISLSRIYLNCHYFLDILVGGLIGYSISRFITKLNKKTFHF